MLEFIWLLFDSSDFPARWHCGTWSQLLGWTHIIADTAIFLAYIGIPISLATVVARRGSDVPFPRLLWLFVAFIVSCGVTHLVEASIFWTPVYRLSGLLKVVTAIISVATLLVLVKALPTLLALPGAHERNLALEREIAERARVTDALRRSEQQLLQANEDLKRFATVTSHDPRAPLRGIRSLAEWVRDDAGDAIPDESREHLDLMISRVGRMSEMVEGLLRYARAESADDQAGGPPVPVRDAVADAWELAGGDDGFTLTVEGDDGLAVGPATALTQVFGNLFANARAHHDRATGAITVTVSERDGWLHIDVQDDGPGVPPEAADRIFELFRTLAPQPSDQVSGLGLAIVRRVVERAGGSIHLNSPDGERGARFSFTWPAAREERA